MDSAASTAPPPGTTDFDSSTRFTTHSASWTERSISSHMKSLAPRSTRLAAVLTFGLQCHMHTDITNAIWLSNVTFLISHHITKRHMNGNRLKWTLEAWNSDIHEFTEPAWNWEQKTDRAFTQVHSKKTSSSNVTETTYKTSDNIFVGQCSGLMTTFFITFQELTRAKVIWQ